MAVEVPTADFLINQMRAGGLDAAIVYRVNVLPQAEHLDSIALPREPDVRSSHFRCARIRRNRGRPRGS